MNKSRGSGFCAGAAFRWLVGAGFLTAAYATLVEPRWTEWNEEEIPLPGLPAALDGMTIIHLTDTHVPRSISREALRHIIKECNRRNPDLVVLTGDLIESQGPEINDCAAIFGELRARYGVVGILGGHDYHWKGDQIAQALRENRLIMLQNSAVAIGPAGAQLWVAGMDDNSDSLRANLEMTLRAVPPGAPMVFLMHSPDSVERASRRGVPFVLAGHTHGGQVCVPFYGPIRTMSRYGRKYASGRRRVGQTVLYTSRGVGTHNHIRFLARPEVVTYRLRRPPAPEG